MLQVLKKNWKFAQTNAYATVSTNLRMVTRLEGATEPTEVLSAMKKLHSFKPDSIQSMDKIIQILGNTGYQYEPEILIYVIQYYCLNEHINSTLSNLLNVEKQFSKFKPGIKEQHLYANLIKSHLEQLKVPKKSPLKMMEYLRMAVERKIDLPERLILKCIITAGSHKNIAIVRELYEIYEKKMTPIMFNEIIHAAGNCGDMVRTQEYFELYQQKFKKQDSFVYVSFAKACVQNDQVPVALDILMKLVPAAGLKCEVRHFNSLLISLMHSGKFEDAEEVWEMMNDIDLGFLPNGNTFDLGVILYSSLNKYEKALKYYCKREKNWEKEWNLVSLGFGHFGLLCLEAKNLNLALEIFKKCGTAGNQLPLFAAICKQKELSSDQILEISSVALKDNKL